MGRVEGERARLQLGEAEAVVDTGELLAEGVRLAADDLERDGAVTELEGGLERVGKTRADVVTHGEPVDNDVEVVPELAVELGHLIDGVDLAVYPQADESGAAGVLDHALVLALAMHDHRRQHHEPRALGPGQDVIHHLLDGLLGQRAPTPRAMRPADSRVQQPQVVVDLGDGSHGRARVVGRGLLVDGDRGRQPLDLIDVGLL